MPAVSNVQVPSSPVVGTTGKLRLEGTVAAPCEGPVGITDNDKLPKCWKSAAGERVPGSCDEYVPVRIVPTGNLPQSPAGIGFPLKVALVIATCAVGAVLSIRTVTVWIPGISVCVLGSLAARRMSHKPSIAG